MDRIILSGIELYAYGGVTEEERRVGQRYAVDVELVLDLSAPGRSDDLADTVSYADIHSVVVEELSARPFQLLEHAATRVSDRILATFPVESVSITLRKLLPPINAVVASAAVQISRRRPPAD